MKKTLTKVKDKGADSLITKDMAIGEIISKKPESVAVMMDSGLHCFGCAVARFETLEQGIIAHGGSSKDVDDVVTKINALGKKAKG